MFRCFRYVSNVANFELTEINNVSKCLGVVEKSKYVRSRGWVPRKRAKAYKGGGGPKINEIEGMYFLNGPVHNRWHTKY